MRRIAAVGGALACALVAVSYGWSLEAVELVAFTAVLAVLSAIDAESRRIPNACVGVAAGIRLAYLIVAGLAGHPDFQGLIVSSLAGALVLGGGLLVVTMLVDRVVGGANLGGGDIKLFAAVGFYFGVWQGLEVLVVACVLGVIGNLVARAFGKAGEGEEAHAFAFGPPIALSCVIFMLLTSPYIGF